MTNPNKISEGRQAAYILGNALTVIGVVFVICFFISAFMSTRNPEPLAFPSLSSHPEFDHLSSGNRPAFPPVVGPSRSGPSFGFILAGVLCLIAGGVIRNTAAKGIAGSGIILDPEQAREDLKPWNSAQGGMVDDALQQIPVVQKLEDALDKTSSQQPASQVVKIRCRACKTLNDEDAQFCKSCAARL